MKSFKSYILLFVMLAFVSFALSYCSPAKQVADGSSKEIYGNDRKLLLRDEGLSQLSYIDLSDPAKNWFVKIPAGRDMQLVGAGRVLIGTGTGYEERDINTGSKLFEMTAFNGTIAARRLRSGNTLLTGLNWQDKKGIVLLEVDKNGSVQQAINFPGFSYVRLVRETASGNFLVAADDTIFEGTAAGAIVWQAKLSGREKPHAWQALRLANGQTMVSGGYTGNFQLFDAGGKFISAITGPAEVKPVFYAGFQILKNGNYVVTNWQGHGPDFGASGNQLLEYSPGGKLVWSWKQDAKKFSSLQGVIVLNDLDLTKMYAEGKNGSLMPVQ